MIMVVYSSQVNWYSVHVSYNGCIIISVQWHDGAYVCMYMHIRNGSDFVCNHFIEKVDCTIYGQRLDHLSKTCCMLTPCMAMECDIMHHNC